MINHMYDQSDLPEPYNLFQETKLSQAATSKMNNLIARYVQALFI